MFLPEDLVIWVGQCSLGYFGPAFGPVFQQTLIPLLDTRVQRAMHLVAFCGAGPDVPFQLMRNA